MITYQVSHRVRFHSVHSHRCRCAETPKQATAGAEEHCWGTGGCCEGVLQVEVDLQRHVVSRQYVTALHIIFVESLHRFCLRWADLLRQQAECWVQAGHMYCCAH